MKVPIKNRLVVCCILTFGIAGFLPWDQSINPAEARSAATGSTFYFSGEFEEHEAVWMGWPTYDGSCPEILAGGEAGGVEEAG